MTQPDKGSRLRGLSLARRLVLNNLLVIVAGSGTVLVTALLVGPAVFALHLRDVDPVPDPALQEHVARAFDQAILVALGVGILIAGVTAAAISWLVAKRLAAPVSDAAEVARNLADGRLTSRVVDPRMGPEFTTLASSVNELAHRLEATEQTRRELTATSRTSFELLLPPSAPRSRRYARAYSPSTTRPSRLSASRVVGSVGWSPISRWCPAPRSANSSSTPSRLPSPTWSTPPWRPSGNGSVLRVLG